MVDEQGPSARPPFSGRVAVFLGAEALSAIGSWATLVAIWGYAAYEYDATAADVSFFGIAFALPALLLGPLAGLVIDRVGPKGTLAGSKVLGVVASLLLLQAHDFHALALLSALHGAAGAFAVPALQSLPPRLVADEHLARTNSLVSLTDTLAIILGPVAAGIGIAVAGFRGAFVFDALTYGLGVAVLPLVKLRPPAAVEDEEPVGLRQALDGWALIVRSAVLRRTVGCSLVVHVLYGLAMLAEPLYVRDVLHRSPTAFAALQTVFGIFLVAGGVVTARLGDRLATFGWVAAGVAASGLTAVVYLGTSVVAVAFVGVALWGLATAVIPGPSRTVVQRATPEAAHGRVLAADFVASSGGELVGLGLAGALVGSLGVQWAALCFGLTISMIAVALAVADRRDRGGPVPDGGSGAALEAVPSSG